MGEPSLRQRQTALTDPAAARRSRDRTEDQLNEIFSRAMRKYLAVVEKEIRKRLRAGGVVLTAAGEPVDPITLGVLAAEWRDVVDEVVMEAILDAYRRVYTEAAQQMPESAVRAAVEDYLPRVKDRLVRGDVYIGGQLSPRVAEDSFDKARVVLSRSAAEGWTRPETAARIALEFGWEKDGPALREEVDRVTSRLNAILDPLGPPGTPEREALRTGRLNRITDPTVRSRLQALRAQVEDLQNQRADLVQALDAEKSYWQNRAELIARTESTSLHGYGSQRALSAEGFPFKKWVSTDDGRTRDSHKDKSEGGVGDVTVPVDAEFVVGGSYAQFPGDPRLPVRELANCRCCLIGTDELD